MDNNKVKPIEVISGDSTNLEISSVSTHIPISKPKIRERDDKEIVIPTEKKINKRKRQMK